MIYDTNTWVVVRIDLQEEIYYKLVVALGFGMNGWRVNSGITKVVDRGVSYEVFGCTGSSYICNKDSEEVSRPMEEILLQRLSEHSKIVSICDIEDKYLLEPND